MALPLPLPGPPTRTPGLPASRRPGPAGFLLQTVTTDVTVKFLTVQFETVVKINGAVIFTTHVLNVLSVYIRLRTEPSPPLRQINISYSRISTPRRERNTH